MERLKRRSPALLVLLGDFNCGMGSAGEPTALDRVATELGLRICPGEADGGATFPALGRRLDWILASPAIRTARCVILPDAVSDHRAVAARLLAP